MPVLNDSYKNRQAGARHASGLAQVQRMTICNYRGRAKSPRCLATTSRS